MTLSPLMILTKDSNTWCSQSNSFSNNVFRPFADTCRRFTVEFIPYRHNTRIFALGCPSFRSNRLVLPNTPFQFNPSYFMRYQFTYYSLTRPSCTSPVFISTALPSRHRYVFLALHTHHLFHILDTSHLPTTGLLRDCYCSIRCISTVHRVTRCFCSCRPFLPWSCPVRSTDTACQVTTEHVSNSYEICP